MSNSFEILAGFLDRFGNEVEGRELQEPPENIQMQLRAFAKGDLAEPAHEELLSLLNQNLSWIAWLAAEVKAMRTERGVKD
jgi:hypothetical protein